MKSLILATVVLLSASCAQAQMGYTRNPIWETPVYYQYPYYYGYDYYGFDGGYGSISSISYGNFSTFRGNDNMSGFRGRTIRSGGYSRFSYYGW